MLGDPLWEGRGRSAGGPATGSQHTGPGGLDLCSALGPQGAGRGQVSSFQEFPAALAWPGMGLSCSHPSPRAVARAAPSCPVHISLHVANTPPAPCPSP